MADEINFLDAVSHYTPDVVQSMIDEGADVAEGCTYQSIHNAALSKNRHTIKNLLDRGAVVSAKNKQGQTLLHYACFGLWSGSDEGYKIHKLLLKRGADCNDQDTPGTTPFLVALAHQPLRVVKLLLKYGADIRAINMHGKTALHWAAKNFLNVGVLKFIQAQGFDVECADKQGQVALHHAAKSSNFKGCELLLNHGAVVTRLNSKSNETPLIMSVRCQMSQKRKL